MAWSAPCTLQVQLQNTLNKNIVARWQTVSKTDIIVVYHSVEAWESQLKQHICNTTVLKIPKKVFQTLIVTRGKPANSTNRIVAPQGSIIKAHTEITKESDFHKLWTSCVHVEVESFFQKPNWNSSTGSSESMKLNSRVSKILETEFAIAIAL